MDLDLGFVGGKVWVLGFGVPGFMLDDFGFRLQVVEFSLRYCSVVGFHVRLQSFEFNV